MKIKNRLPKVPLILVVATLLVAAYLIISGKFTGSVSPEPYESLKKTYEREVEKLAKLNRELIKQLAQIRERLEEISEERDSLEHDKSQLLFMLEKLEQRVNNSNLASEGEKMIRKFAQSWLMRILDLKDGYIQEGAASRDALVGEVNKIIEGLKEDFSEDSFLTQVRDCTISSNFRKDIKNAQEKLDALSTHLREYYLPDDE